MIALCAALFALFWVVARGRRKESASRACFEAMFSRHDPRRALELLQEYRELAKDDVPGSVRDDLLRLKADAYKSVYPLYAEQLDEEFIDRTIFFCLVSDAALGRAGDLRHAAMLALRYVRRNVQSGGGPPEARRFLVTPLHVLCRGYADPVQSSWIMARLLRSRGVHAAVILLRDASADKAAGEDDPEDKVEEKAEDKETYGLVGVIMEDKKLYLFDPYRGVPICRASDGCVADLQTLLSGRDKLAPGFGGPGTPVTLERIKKAAHFVPAAAASVLPDAFLLGQILRDNGRHDVVYRSFRNDLRNMAAAVFGHKAKVQEPHLTRLTVAGRDDLVALWDYPFKVDKKLAHTPGYFERLTKAHRAMASVYLAPRQAQLHGMAEVAGKLYDKIVEERGDDTEVVEDITFFKACMPEESQKRATLLAGYLGKYPSGHWRPLATVLRAEFEARLGNREAALKLTSEIKGPPYGLRADLLARAVRDGKRQIAWRFPK